MVRSTGSDMVHTRQVSLEWLAALSAYMLCRGDRRGDYSLDQVYRHIEKKQVERGIIKKEKQEPNALTCEHI